MQCNSCKTENRVIAHYCKHCGSEIPVIKLTGNGNGINNGIQDKDNLTGDIDLDELIGLTDLKSAYQKAITAFRRKRQAGINYDKKDFHSLLIGETGTGKSRIVEILSRVFYKAGITTRIDPRIVAAVDFYDFAGDDLSKNIDDAKGSILYIDNVHQLVKGGSSAEIDRLIRELEKRPGDPILVLGGRTEELREYLRNNPENNSRIHMQFYLPKMTVEIMLGLAERFAAVDKLSISEAGMDKLRKRLIYLFRQQSDAEQVLLTGQNGFLVHKEMKKISAEFFTKKNYDPMAPRVIKPEDITGKIAEIKSVEEVLRQLDDFVGMTDVKTFIKSIMDEIAIGKQDAAGKGRKYVFSGAHMVLTGNPGTGKTTLARALGEVFTSAGILTNGHVIDSDRSRLIGQYKGETAKLVQKACDEAMGGVLLIDEVYALKQNDQDDYGQEAIDTLLKRMEDDRDKFIVIAAGYEKLMPQFLSANPGMKSRFKHFFHLNDYTGEQMLDIFKIFARNEGITLHPAAEKKVAAVLEEMYKKRTNEFANGRDVRNLFDTIKNKRSSRIVAGDADYSILEQDVPGNDADLSKENVASLLAKLNALTGLDTVKKEINDLIEYIEGCIAIGETADFNLHFIFSGNPGTGKTTVARILAEIFKALGVLPRGQLVETGKMDLVAQHVGETAIKTTKVIDRAMGGVLFIDEAYSLASTGAQYDFNSEAIETLLIRLENDRGKFIVIAAGYTAPMQKFLDSNPGLPSRFTRMIEFPDYTSNELMTIMTGMLDKAGRIAGAETMEVIRRRIEHIYKTRDASFANARTVRTEFERIRQLQTIRIGRAKKAGTDVNVMEVLPEDIPGYRQPAGIQEESLETVMAEINGLIGLQSVKRELRSLVAFLEMEKLRRERGGADTTLTLHFLFKGAPGTGKTTVARILAKVFKYMGLLPKGHLVETDRGGLVGTHIGQTAPKTTDIINASMGGVLFIDEAYTLVQEGIGNDFGKEAIATLLKRMEDDRGKFIVIAAGYNADMERFLQSNDGLPSRFTKEIIFEDYQPQELAAIYRLMLRAKGMQLSDEAAAFLPRFFEHLYAGRDNRFANGRTVRNIFNDSLQRQSSRLVALQTAGQDIEEMLNIIEPADIATQ